MTLYCRDFEVDYKLFLRVRYGDHVIIVWLLNRSAKVSEEAIQLVNAGVRRQIKAHINVCYNVM